MLVGAGSAVLFPLTLSRRALVFIEPLQYSDGNTNDNYNFGPNVGYYVFIVLMFHLILIEE